MQKKALIEKMERCGVIPVIAIESPALALPLADALMKGGLPIAEITFRTVAAGESLQILKRERPELLLGAGTILSVADLVRAKEYGAEFGVSPGFDLEIVERAHEIGLPFFPGVVTPSEIGRGLNMGIKWMKYFPAEASGGIKMLKAVSSPFAHLGVRFIPTGGITMDNLGAYLAQKSVLAVGGTWIADKTLISEEKWDVIGANAKAAKEEVYRVRGQDGV